MSNAIHFLETLGTQPALFPGITSGYQDAVRALQQVAPAEREALAGREIDRLGDLLGGRTQMWCYVATPDNEEEGITPEQEDRDGDGDSDEGDVTPARPAE